MVGGAPNVKIMALRIFDDDGGAFASDIANAVVYAADNGAHVSNMSFGSGVPNNTVRNAVAFARSAGVVQVAAAGNGNSTSRQYPATYEGVISVGASDHGSDFGGDLFDRPKDIDGRAAFSQFGTTAVDVVAPGRYILSALLPAPGRPNEDVLYVSIPEGNGLHAIANGTSFASPLVASLAALIVSRDLDIDGVRDLSSNDVENVIQTHTVDLPDDPDDSPDGGADWDSNGRVHFASALESLGGPLDPPPTVTITSPADGSCFPSGTVPLTAAASDPDEGDLSASIQWTSSLDGGLGSGATIVPVLSDGSHVITAAVTDAAGQTRSDEIAIFVGPALPIADAGQDQTVIDGDGNGVETVTLDGMGSSDSCGGTIVTYEWFEGNMALGIGATLNVDLTVATHTITLVVTDDEGGTASDDVVVKVEEAITTPTFAFVECISYNTFGGRHGNRHLEITIRVIDDLGFPVENAQVTIWVFRDGLLWSSGQGLTGQTGRVIFSAKNAMDACYETAVLAVLADGLIWDLTSPPNSFCKGSDPVPSDFCR